MGILHRVTRLVAGNADGGGGGAAVDLIRQADHIGPGVVVVGELAADPLNAHVPDTVGVQYPLGGLRAGEVPPGELGGIFLKGGIDIGAGPQGQKNTGQHQNDIRPVKAVIIHGIHNETSKSYLCQL